MSNDNTKMPFDMNAQKPVATLIEEITCPECKGNIWTALNVFQIIEIADSYNINRRGYSLNQGMVSIKCENCGKILDVKEKFEEIQKKKAEENKVISLDDRR